MKTMSERFLSRLQVSLWRLVRAPEYYRFHEPSQKPLSPGTKAVIIASLCGALAWITWSVHVRGAHTLWLQHAAQSYPQSQGEVLSSQVRASRIFHGIFSYHADITYRYLAGGVSYTGHCYGYGDRPNDPDSVYPVVRSNPKGTLVNVYVNPRNPTDAVLSTAIFQGDVARLFKLLPVSLLLVWGLVITLRQNERWKRSTAGGVVTRAELGVTHVCLVRHEPLALGLLTAGVGSFVAGVLINGGELSSPWLAGWCSLVGVIFAGTLAYLGVQRVVESGRHDLIIDEGKKLLCFPPGFAGRLQGNIPFSHIDAIVLRNVGRPTLIGPRFSYMVSLKMKDDSEQGLIDLDKAKAMAFASWLKGRLGFVKAARR